MRSSPAAPLAGFRDPAGASQEVFRLLLDAMARPGSRMIVPGGGIDPPPGVPLAAAAVLLTLLDHETPYWVCADLATSVLRGWVAFHAGAPWAGSAGDARFALIRGDRDQPPLAAFAAGEDRYPDRSATVLVACESLSDGPRVALSGPGIAGERAVAPAGLRTGFWDEALHNHQRFPLGVDLILCAGDELLCLPRSTKIATFAEAA